MVLSPFWNFFVWACSDDMMGDCVQSSVSADPVIDIPELYSRVRRGGEWKRSVVPVGRVLRVVSTGVVAEVAAK